jgi:ribosomal subunit interface protein
MKHEQQSSAENPMQINIQARNFSLTDALRSHAERRLRFALTCCDDHIQRVVMRLSDINGPRGGADKRCHLQVVLAGLPDVVIEDTEADLYVAIDRATDRAGRTVGRRLARQRDRGRVSGLYDTVSINE